MTSLGILYCGGNQNSASIICTPLGVQAPVAKRRSTENTHAVRCAGKNPQGFHPAENAEILHGGVVSRVGDESGAIFHDVFLFVIYA